MPLTKRQQEVLEFLRASLQQNGFSPSLEEIARHFGMASLNGVFKHLRVLEERGFIRRLSNRARSIQIVDPEQAVAPTLPLLGVVAAGQPVEAIEVPDEVSVPESFLTRGPNFVLRVEGDSMVDEHIQDGDLVVVEKRETAHNGEMVVALVDSEATTLKRYYREGSRIRLQPSNALMEPIYIDEQNLRIQGIVVGLMRRY